MLSQTAKCSLVQVQKLRIGHDNNGSTPGWYLEEVAVDVPAHSQHVIFPCHRWLAKNEDDGKIERDLMPGSHFALLVLFTGLLWFKKMLLAFRVLDFCRLL